MTSLVQDIWQWTLSKSAIAPCFVRDVLDLRDSDADFFWLGHTPCRTVLLVGMVVAIQPYDQRTIYTIDDGTAVIDCVLRHPRPKPGPSAQSTVEPPSPLTEPGYPVRVVGRVARHYQSKQIHADSIVLCPSSLDEIAHLERVIELHKTMYSLAVPFVPPKSSSRAPDTCADATVFSDPSIPNPSGPRAAPYSLPAPLMPLQIQNRPATHMHSVHPHTHFPSSPTASSIASSTPSSPCKPSSPVKPHEAPGKPKLRHPSRLHTRDLTANTFRLYVKHYMDNAPPPFFLPTWSSPSAVATPTKHVRCGQGQFECGRDDATPRPGPRPHAGQAEHNEDEEQGQTLGFTLSHLRRVPELALLAARVVRVETRKRDKAEREKTRSKTQSRGHQPPSLTTARACGDPIRKKMKRLFTWAVVKLYEEGSIVLWDGEVRPLPIPPPPPGEEGGGTSGMWRNTSDPSVSVSTCGSGSRSVLYDLSASASLYSHYHAPRRQVHERSASASVVEVDDDADPGDVSDPGVDEEAYIPVTPRLLERHVREAVMVQRRRGVGSLSAGEVLKAMQRMDGRWARIGTWAIEEALTVVGIGC